MKTALTILILLLLAVPGTQTRSFRRVMLLEEKAETSASVSVGDLNGDGLIDIVLAKGRHWPLHDRVLLNDGKGGFIASNLSDEADRTYSAALLISISTVISTSLSVTIVPIRRSCSKTMAKATSLPLVHLARPHGPRVM